MKEPYDTDYGSREVMFRDPEGNRWSFGTYAGEPRRARTDQSGTARTS